LLALAYLVGGAPAVEAGDREYFEPADRLPGIGVDRAELSDDIIARRAGRMIESQTFVILRDPRAAAGAQRILSPKLDRLFSKAASASGLPSSLIAAIAYIESFGDPRAQSPSGPRGIMQIAAGTAGSMGLKIVYRKRYRIQTRTRRLQTRQGKWITRRVRVRVPYKVLVRDERMIPEKAVPAAAKYLARLAGKFDGLDWAVFAYHCGESCAAEMRSLTQQAVGIQPPYTVAKMFFAASPAVNRELYLAVRRHMDRDYSPTYWFRVMRASQLLALYQKDPRGLRLLAAEFRYSYNPKQRAPHRLAVWLNGDDLGGGDDLDIEYGEGLVRAFDDPDYYGFRFRTTGAGYPASLASPSAVGTLAYIAFETRRLHEAMNIKGERFAPLEVTSLVTPLGSPPAVPDRSGRGACDEISHSTGHVFDIDYGNVPPGQREALDFVLNDLGWEGYLGFIRVAPDSQTLHIGCSPAAREFFEAVYADASADTGARAIAGGG
jgi:soluble lytic murein transglycosylase-like protein